MENVENYTKKVSKMCKIPHFPHFNKNKGVLYVKKLSPLGWLN